MSTVTIATGEKELSAGFLDVDDIPKTPANLTVHGLIQEVSVLIQQNYIYNSFSPISKFTVYIHCDSHLPNYSENCYTEYLIKLPDYNTQY